MPKRQISTKKGASPAGAYSQGLKAGDFVFVSGQGPLDPETDQVVGETIEEQTAQTLDNLREILAEAGLGFGDVVKATVHLSDLDLFARFNDVYTRHFPDPKPVRTTVGSRLAGILVEIDLVAYDGQR
jgi:2-iminobutanoate/2-iminopropanoate deaminase